MEDISSEGYYVNCVDTDANEYNIEVELQERKKRE